ncbi:RTX toxin [Vibrio maerlii]|uniref:T1SS-143 repeat domain-containing protein n=1 Tax=Vibrio maerlii TaxID=2231648 RepID=UPI000E3BBD4A|nr:RTX toxin [Vibrio maerlii]
MSPILYIEVGNVLWQVLPDGTWQQIPLDTVKVDGVLVIKQDVDGNTLVENQQQTEEVAEQLEQVVDQLSEEFLSNNLANPSNQANSPESASASFIEYVQATLDETIAQAGFDTRPDTPEPNEVNRQDEQIQDVLEANAQLTVDILDGGDFVENRFEVPNVTIEGTAPEMRDGRIVNITITDINGKTVTTTAVTDNETYRVEGVDLTGLAEGPLNVDAIVSDNFGNSVSAVDDTNKDTLAEIEVDFDGLGDEYFNQFEVSSTRIFGSIDFVEDGQPIEITIKDSQNTILTFSTIVSGGTWEILNEDFSALAEGLLEVTAESIDIAGNPAIAVDTIVKDTIAGITAQIEDGGDAVLNVEEKKSANFSGAVTDVEDGQNVHVVITDSSGATLEFDTTISNGEWSVEDVDVTSFADGVVTVTASSIDIAGNPTSTTDTTTSIDTTLPTIDIDTLAGFSILDFRTGNLTTLQGTTTGVDEGLPIYVIVSDGSTTLTYESTIKADGSWGMSGIDTSTLDRSQTWTLDAKVLNAIGNEAVDDMPTLVLPDSIIFAETIIGILGSEVQTSNINIEFAEFSFASDQSFLNTITSQGVGVTANIAPDGLSIEGRDSLNDLVYSAEIVGDQVRVTFYQAVDQGVDVDSIQTALLIQGVQTDADGTTETVLAHLPIVVKDSDPLVFGESYDMIEGTTSSGNFLNNDIDLDGALLIREVTVGNETKVITGNQPVTFLTVDGLLTVFANGHWTMQADRNLDHSTDHQVVIDYVASDGSNDFGTATATIDIFDGSAGSINDGSTQTQENTLTDGALTISADFNVEAGSDNPDPASIEFASTSLVLLKALGLETTLNLEKIDYSLSADGKTITATANGAAIFSLTLSAVASGDDVLATIELNQQQPISHLLASDAIKLPLEIKGSDLDGTTLNSGRFDWTITDGADPTLSNAQSIVLNESDLATGPITSSGQFSLTIGSDYLDSVFFDIADQPSLTSGGETVVYVVNPDGSLSAYVEDVDIPRSPDLDKLVFTVSFTQPANNADSTINYDLVLHRALDQKGTAESLPIVVTARDRDNDETKLELDITINDDGDPIIGSGEVELSEVPIADGITVGPTASVTFDVTASYDPIVFLGLEVTSGAPVLDTEGNQITQNGESLTWRDNGDGSYDAILPNGQSVLLISLPANFSLDPESSATVSVDIELYQSIDHIGSDETASSITVPVITVDSDGTTKTVESTIKIYDGLNPVLEVVGSIDVDEAGLLTGNVDSGNETDSPSIVLTEGSDDIVDITVNIAEFDAEGYTSGGKAITLNDKDADGYYFGVTSDGSEIFRVRFNLDGSVEFDLLAPLDHDPVQGENNLPLDFSINAVDADGDLSDPVDYTVNVKDDTPLIDGDSTVYLVEGDLLTGNILSVNDRVGADGGEMVSLNYKGTLYVFIEPETPVVIELINENDLSSYGTFTVYQNGDFTLETNQSVDADPALLDDIIYVIEDFDGDTDTGTIKLSLGDNEGFIRTYDVEIREDEEATLRIEVSRGDVDQGETVTEISIDAASLQGGILYLDGIALDIVDGKVTITNLTVDVGNPLLVVPDGVLTYRPAEHQSNTTLNPSPISLIVGAVITADSGTRDLSEDLDVSVLPVADTPEWGSSTFTYEMIEDDESGLNLDITANLVDATDGSETLKYSISGVPEGITIFIDGQPIEEGKNYSQSKLDKMVIKTDENIAGQFTFTITAIAIEDGNEFASNDDKRAETTETVIVNVRPDVDEPFLSVKDIKGLEDEPINLKDHIFAHLTDTDGSESLRILIEVQDGWEVIGGAKTGANSYTVTAEDLESGSVFLVPKEDISSFTETLEIQVSAIATESTQDGLIPNNPQAISPKETITIFLKGVVDEPTVVDGGQGHWQYDDSTKVISNLADLNEDELIALDFVVQTSDDDVSEEINILLTDIPDGTQLVDSSGSPVVLTIAYVDPITGPVYQVSNADLANIFLKPQQDFSGNLTLDVIAISTEPDGDSGEFPMTVEIEVLPVVDQSDGVAVTTSGVEDRTIGLNLMPSINADIDGSESLTGYTIVGLDADLTLLFDGVEVAVEAGGLDLSTLLDTTSPTLEDLLLSGRLSVQASEDLSGTFNLDISYQVTDTSPTGAVDVKDISGTLTVDVAGKVELDTRLESSGQIYTSDDGSPVNISDAVTFYDADLDGSEYLDYIVIFVPDGVTLIVDHPNGASQNANGDWIIPADGLSSDSVKETAARILENATISSPQDTELLDILVRARVIDDEDARFIDATFQLQITGHSGGGGSCDPVGSPGDIQSDDIKQPEGEDIDLSGLLNTNVGSDPDNELSFYIPADSLPEGVTIEGDGVTVEYDRLGNVIGYSITPEALGNLKLTGMDEDFAGCLTFTIETIETSPCNGDSVTTEQTITIQVTPVVDDISIGADSLTIEEDTQSNLNLSLILGDSVEDGQLITGEGNSATGKETVNSLTVSITAGASLVGPNDVLSDNGDGTWTILDPARLNEVELVPPLHFSGELTLTFSANITDAADCVTETDTQDKTTSITIDVAPVTDLANLVTSDVLGNEDEYISLSSMTAELIDQDGSESMSLSLKGVPEGAVVVYKVGESYELAPNNGADGGSFNGANTYEWQVDPSRIADLYILPPLDFSGDIPLALEAITQEIESGEVNFTESEFVVGVLPIGDRVELVDLPETITGEENDGVAINLEASSFETNSDEYISLTVIVNATSDSTALFGLDKIRIGISSAAFVTNSDGSASASLLVRADEIDKITFFPGDAYGEMDVTIQARSYDENTVLGNLEFDYGDPVSEDLTIIIEPEPDEPILTVDYASIISEADGAIPLGLDLSLINPAPDESGFIVLSGLPSNLELNAGAKSNGKYTVDLADIEDLAIISGYDGADSFQLTIEPSATLGGSEATGIAQTVDVTLLVPGTDSMGTGDNDLFVINNSTGTDNIVDFDFSANSDAIDISAIVSGVTNGTSADGQIDLAESGADVVISLKPDSSNVQQEVVLKGVTLDNLYGASANGVSEADILQKMIDDQNLIVQ